MSVHGSRQFCIDVSPLMHQKITERAKQAGVAPSRYATALLEAAWAARCGKSMGDGELDAWVGACIVLYGGGHCDRDHSPGAQGKPQGRPQDSRRVAADHQRIGGWA